jgi:microcystin-dependent protein
MRFREFAAAALAAIAIAGTAVPAIAQSSGYTIAPAGPADPRNNYVPQAGPVFVVDDARGAIIMCFPDNKDNKVVVVCTPATKLPQ